MPAYAGPSVGKDIYNGYINVTLVAEITKRMKRFEQTTHWDYIRVIEGDIDRAREFYEGKLGLSVGIDSGDNVAYRCAEPRWCHDGRIGGDHAHLLLQAGGAFGAC